MTTKIICISDTHNYKIPIPDGDILIHAGDATSRGTVKETAMFGEWLRSLNFTHILFVPGNHDLIWEQDFSTASTLLPDNVQFLIDDKTNINDINFWGTPYQPEFMNWAFNLPRGGEDLKRKWSLIPNDTDILITHSPAFGVGDEVIKRAEIVHVGDEDLNEKLINMTNSHTKTLQYHIYGHIHGSYGIHRNHGVTSINASICNEKYKPVNSPITIYI